MPRHEKANQQCANRKSKNVTYRSQIKVANAHHEKVADDGVEEAPQNVHGRRGKTFAGRLCEGSLEGPSHHAADKMRNGVGHENPSNKVRHQVKPGHGYVLLVASRLRMSWVEPVSPRRGKTIASVAMGIRFFSKASIFNEAREQVGGRSKPFLLLGGELLLDCCCEPILPCRATVPKQLLAFPGE